MKTETLLILLVVGGAAVYVATQANKPSATVTPPVSEGTALTRPTSSKLGSQAGDFVAGLEGLFGAGKNFFGSLFG